MKEIAENYLGEEVTEAVVTVPAYFDDAQRQATKDAGRIAGLDVERIINEPTAAALAYGLDRKERRAHRRLRPRRRHLRHLDPRDRRGVFEVQATNGDTHLGGEDFDQRIVDHLADDFLRGARRRPPQGPPRPPAPREAAEKAKHELSSSLETEINLPFIAADGGGPLHLERRSRAASSSASSPTLVERTLGPCRRALADAGLARRHRGGPAGRRHDAHARGAEAVPSSSAASPQGRPTPTRSSPSAPRSRAPCSRARSTTCCSSTSSR
jgi:molecular chaperone DnaK